MALNLAKHKILIVDDVREMRMSLISLTKSMGARQVFEAKSGEEAIEQLQAKEIDIVLCDYNLGEGRDGQQVFEEAKEFGMISPHTAFIMITADNSANVVMAVVDHSPDSYLIKPLNKSSLESRLEQVLQRKRIFKQIESWVAVCDLMITKHPKMRFDLLRVKSDVLFDAGNIDAAAEVCAGILMEREVPWAAIGMGRARYLAGDLVKARQLFNKAIEQNHTSMDAYDWLVRIGREEGDLETTQKTLEQIVELSPKSIARQQILADVAAQNGDHETARKAFNAAVGLGEHSCFARVEDQVGLVNAVAETGGPDEALEVIEALNKTRSRARGSANQRPEWPLHLSQAELLFENRRADEARACIEKALANYAEEPRNSKDLKAIALAKACYSVDMHEQAQELTDRIVRENHDDDSIILAVRAMYSEMGMDDVGADFVDSARRQVIEINNRGVGLAREGDLDAAIELLTHASDDLPGNLTIVLNVLQAIVAQIKHAGYSNQRQYLINEYLGRAENIDRDNELLIRLRKKLKKMQQVSQQKIVA
jgi:CheY-like chemotaxis protein/predicted Zn-dependent protease